MLKVIRESRRRIRLQKRDIRGVPNYSLTAPRELVEKALKWGAGTELDVVAIEVEIKGKKVRGIFYYKP